MITAIHTPQIGPATQIAHPGIQLHTRLQLHSQIQDTSKSAQILEQLLVVYKATGSHTGCIIPQNFPHPACIWTRCHTHSPSSSCHRTAKHNPPLTQRCTETRVDTALPQLPTPGKEPTQLLAVTLGYSRYSLPRALSQTWVSRSLWTSTATHTTQPHNTKDTTQTSSWGSKYTF